MRTFDEILETQSPEALARARKAASGMLIDIHLSELRDRMNMTQNQIAEAIGVKQPAVSDMEKPGRDLKLSSLKRYVEASGGKLHIDVELPDGSHYGFSV